MHWYIYASTVQGKSEFFGVSYINHSSQLEDSGRSLLGVEISRRGLREIGSGDIAILKWHTKNTSKTKGI